MLRGILSGIVLAALAVVVLAVFVLTGRTAQDLRERAKVNLDSGREVVRVASRVQAQSLMFTADQVARRSDVHAGMLCPRSSDDLARVAEPVIDPTTGQPQVDASGAAIRRDGATCVTTRHEAVRRALDAWNASQAEVRAMNEARFLSERTIDGALARDPDLLLAVDVSGEVVARTGRDWRNWYGPERVNVIEAHPIVGRALEFGVQHGVILWRNHTSDQPTAMQIAAAPVRRGGDLNGEVVGVVVQGYQINRSDADDIRRMLSVSDVLFFAGDNQTPTFFAGNTLDARPGFRDALRTAEYFEITADGSVSREPVEFAHIIGPGAGGLYQLTSPDGSYFVMPSTFVGAEAGGNHAGFIVLSSSTDAIGVLKRFRTVTPLIALFVFFLALAAMLFVVSVFLYPIDEIGRGIQEVIAGNHDYMWPVEGENYFSDLAHGLNIMSARLQGKVDPDADDFNERNREWRGLVSGQRQTRPSPAVTAAHKAITSLGSGRLRGRSAQDEDDKE